VARGQDRGIGRGAGVPGGIAPNLQTKFVTQKLLVPDNSGPLGSFVNTLSSSPQIANYNLIAGIGFFLASVVSGQVPGANAQEYRHGTHAVAIQTAEGLKTTIFSAAASPPATATAVPPFISVQQQTYDDVKPALFKPVIIGQGAVPATTLAPPQSDPTQIGAQIFEPLAPTAIVSNPIAAFFATLPQDENRQYSTIWKSQTAGQKPPVIPFTRSVSQDDTSQIAALVIKASQSAPAVSAQWVPPPVIGLQQIYSDILPAAIMPSLVAGSLPGANAQEYRWGSHAQATHEAERAKTKVFPSAVTPPTVVSAVPPSISIGQQVYDDVRQTALTKPSIAGSTPTVRPVFTAGSQLVDLTLQPVITKPLITGQGPFSEYPDPAYVLAGVVYGPGGMYTGTLTLTAGESIIGLRSFTGRF